MIKASIVPYSAQILGAAIHVIATQLAGAVHGSGDKGAFKLKMDYFCYIICKHFIRGSA